MTDDLVARLRRVAPSCPQYAPYAHEAADEIERLRVEVRDLEGDVAYWKDEYTTAADEITRVLGERDALRQDAERLDWLDSQCSQLPAGRTLMACLPGHLRAAIDAARGGK